MPRSFRICAPSPTSRHCRVRAASELGVARTESPASARRPRRRAGYTMHAAALLLETLQRRMHRIGAAEHVADDVGAMQPRQHVLAVADLAVDDGHVMDRVERRHIGIAGQRADLALDRKLADPLDQLLARLPVGDQVGDRNLRELVALGEGRDRRARASPCRRRSSARTARRPAAGRRAGRDRCRPRYGRSASARRPPWRPAERRGPAARNRRRRCCRWRARARCWCAPRPRCRWSARGGHRPRR